MFHNAELADTVIHFNNSIAQGVCRHEPLVIVAAVAFIHDTAVVGLDDAIILECGTAGHDVCFIAFGQLHGNTQRDEFEFAGFQFYSFCGSQVDPVGFAVDVAQFFNLIT